LLSNLSTTSCSFCNFFIIIIIIIILLGGFGQKRVGDHLSLCDDIDVDLSSYQLSIFCRALMLTGRECHTLKKKKLDRFNV
jgi:hypothetical protein